MTTNKQLFDIHEEARRIADSQKAAPSHTSTTDEKEAEQVVPAPAVVPVSTDASAAHGSAAI